MDDRSAKRRRVSVTRSISISPIKIAADSGPIATRASPRPSPQHSLPTDSTQAGLATAKSGTTAPRGSLGLDGARDDVFDMMNIGKERRGVSRRFIPTPLRNTASDRGSPVSSVQASAGIVGGTATRRSIGGKAKRVSFAAAGGGLRETSVGIEADLPEGSRDAGQEEDGTLPNAHATMQDTESTPVDTNVDMTGEDPDDEEPSLPKLPTPDTPYGPAGLMSSSPSGQAARRLTSRRSMLPPGPAARRESVTVPKEATPIDEVEEEMPEQDQNDVEHDDPEQPLDPEQDETEILPDDEDFDEDLEEPLIPLLPKGPIIMRDVSSDAKRDELESLLRERRRLSEQVDRLEKACIGMEHREPNRTEARGIVDLILETPTRPKPASHELPKILSQRLAAFLPFEPQKKAKASAETTSDSRPEVEVPPIRNEILDAFAPLSLKAEHKAAFFEDKHMEAVKIHINSPDNLLKLELGIQIDPDNGRMFQVFFNEGGSDSEWPKPELGQYLSQHTKGDGGSGTSDVITIGRAVSCYWELASLRARTWQACFEDHSDLAVGIPDIRSSESDDNTAKRQALSLHLGRQSLRLEKDGVGLLISWTIEFDCTGEASSHVSACAAFPKSWRQRNDAQAFDHVGELFDLFLRKFGVRRAVTIMVELMFGRSD